MSFGWLFFAAIAFAALDWYAAWKENRVLLFIAKPATLLFLILWSIQITGWQGAMFWFGLGLIFSLGGDIALLFSARWFLAGLGFFLLAHIAFIIGFNIPMPGFTVYSAMIAVMVALAAGQILKAIRPGIMRLPSKRLMMPATMAYGLALSIMWLSALLTFFNAAWNPLAAVFAAAGGCFFLASDSMLSFDRFVKKLTHGRFWVHVTYHLGVAGIIIGAVLNFTK
ncbi:MAG: lysoplasmalogenase [Anaerolineaceae bacterium]